MLNLIRPHSPCLHIDVFNNDHHSHHKCGDDKRLLKHSKDHKAKSLGCVCMQTAKVFHFKLTYPSIILLKKIADSNNHSNFGI